MPTLNSRGHEVNSPEPISLPAGVNKPETLAETIRRLVRNEVSQQASASGQETFEEADDFDIEDDNGYDPKSQWELDFDQEQFRPPEGNVQSDREHENGRAAAPGTGNNGKPDSGSGKERQEDQGANHHANANRSTAA